MVHIDTPQSACRFGVARCDITPPYGIYHRMWGAASHDQAEGVHRPLTATAVVFGPHQTEHEMAGWQVVVALDHCLLWAEEMERVRSGILAATHLAPEQLIITFSHTHAAGLMGLERGNLPGGELIAPYLDRMTQKLAVVVSDALSAVEDVNISYATTFCGLAANRDFYDQEREQYVCGFNPHAMSDDTLLVARVTNSMGKTIATMVNYACHPTTLAWDNRLISPDYPGAMREVVEGVTGAPCVFLQGASGDLGPVEGFVGDTEVADRNGRQLGFAVLSALEALPPPLTQFKYVGPVVSGATIGCWKHIPLSEQAEMQLTKWRIRRWNVKLPYRSDLASVADTEQERRIWKEREAAARAEDDLKRASECRAMIERTDRLLVRLRALTGDYFSFPIAVWQIGDAFWVAVEGEPYNRLQSALREEFSGVPIMVCELANGSRCTYLPTESTYGRGIYQETNAVLAPGCLEAVLREVHDQIEAWQKQS